MKKAEGGLAPGKRTLLIGFVAALAGALGLALLGIAFLLGRLSAQVDRSAAPPVAVLRPEASPATTPTLNDPVTAPEEASPPPAPNSEESLPWGDPSRDVTAVAPTPGATPQAPAPPERARVMAYFQEVDRLEDMGAGDPQEFAKSLMESMTSGDFSAFDALLAKARAQRDRLRTLAPPSACVQHHRRAAALASDSVSLMEKLKAGLIKGDATALMSMATEGRALETRAEELRSLSATIRRQAGL